jgi:CBS domain-containing protein
MVEAQLTSGRLRRPKRTLRGQGKVITVQVAELLKNKGDLVATVRPDASIRIALHELGRHNVGALVVSSDSKTIEGMVSERDIVRELDRTGAAVLDAVVRSIMSVSVTTCAPEDSVESLIAVMTTNRVRHIPVIEDGSLVGIVSIGDVVKTRMDELEGERAALMNYITAR